MSKLNDLRDGSEEQRDGITGQIVAVFEAAIATGELQPGAKLPPTRELAELAGVNHLTAARAYRRLAETGLVAAKVGSGTFVRAAAPVGGAEPGQVSDSIAWQRYVLPEVAETLADRVFADLHQVVGVEGMIPLSTGYPAPRTFPLEDIRRLTGEAIAADAERALQYGDVCGASELVEQIVALQASRGAEEDSEDVIVTTGATQGLTLAMRAILLPGDVVACEDPSFMSVIHSVRSSGARVMPVPVDRHGLDVDALEGLLARNEIKALAIQPRLHNPTGFDLAAERRTRLLELARRHGFFIVEDGIYADLRFEGDAPRSLRADAPAHVIYVDSLSKTLGGGLRVGWVNASGPVVDRIIAEKRADDVHSATLPQLVVARYLAAGMHPAQIERSREHHRVRRDALVESIHRHLGSIASFEVPPGGGHIWVELDSAVSESDLSVEARRQGVAYTPGGAMRVARSAALEMRLTFSFLDPEQIDEGVRRIATALRTVAAPRTRRAAAPV